MFPLYRPKVLIVAPHPDDEIIGCGGIISRIKEEGGKVYVLFLTNGTTVDFSNGGRSTVRERRKEVESVARYMGYDDYDIVFGGNEYHLRLDNLPRVDLISKIEKDCVVSYERVKPDIVLFPQATSYNQDHWQSSMAVFTASRPSDPNLKHQPRVIATYESPADQWSIFGTNPGNYFVGLSENHLEKKISGFKLYKSQTRDHPNLRSFESLRSLAVIRGGQCGFQFAEGFCCHRAIAGL